MNEAQGWSVVLPVGWEVVAQNDQWAAVSPEDTIAEILVGPSSGLTLRELEAQKVDELIASWPGLDDIESDVVRLPAGEALNVTLESTNAEVGVVVFTMYLIEQGDRQYVISVRAPDDRDKVLAAADVLAESFAILD